MVGFFMSFHNHPNLVNHRVFIKEPQMKYHIITALSLIGALLFYMAGAAGVGLVAFLIGAACELYFWVRVVTVRK
jgi:hypothetical protein